MDYYEQFLAVDRIRRVRRRYLLRAIRNAARSSMHAAQSNGRTAGLVALASVAAISALMWIVPHGS